MSKRLHLLGALRVALFAAPAYPVSGQIAAPAQSRPPVPAVPAAPGKYDFQWEKYTVRSAPAGKAFYVFEGQQPVAILAQGTEGKSAFYPIVSGPAAEELRASFSRYEKAKGVGATPLSKTSTVASITTSPLQATKRAGMPPMIFHSGGVHVSLNDGTSVEFLPGSIEVTMPAVMPSLPATKVSFSSNINGEIGQALGETGIAVNGKPIDRQEKGPVWDGLKALVLSLALGRAAQAARLAGDAPARPPGSPDYVAVVAEIQRHLN
jgi:hypothetical protein